MNIYKNGPEDFGLSINKTRISPIEFYIHQYKPENSENLQAQIEFIEKIAPLIVQEKSITAQNSYIHILADSLASFDYAQIEQIVNESRQAIKAESHGRYFQTDVNHYACHQAVISYYESRSSSTSSNDGISSCFERLPFKEDFAFDTPEFQVLYDLLG